MPRTAATTMPTTRSLKPARGAQATVAPSRSRVPKSVPMPDAMPIAVVTRRTAPSRDTIVLPMTPAPRTTLSSGFSANIPEEEVTALLVSAQSGDQVAFRRLVDLFRSKVIAIAFRIVGDMEDAKDISQLVFVKVYHNLHMFDTNRRFFTWLYRITMNAAIDYHRMHGKHKHEDVDLMPETADKPMRGTSVGVETRELETFVRSVLDTMSYEQRQTFILRDMEGFSVEEISSILGRPEATVRWYLHRARTILKGRIEQDRPEYMMYLRGSRRADVTSEADVEDEEGIEVDA